MIFDLQKNGALLAAGIAIGVAGHSMLSGAISTAWRVSPFSAESKLDKTRDRLATMTGQYEREHQARLDRDAEITKRDKSAVAYGAQAAVDMTDTVARWGEQCQAAFKSGVAFGAARATPRTSSPGGPGHAPAPVPAPAGRPAAGGVSKSFRDDWAAGAFDPARPAGARDLSGAGGRPPGG